VPFELRVTPPGSAPVSVNVAAGCALAWKLKLSALLVTQVVELTLVIIGDQALLAEGVIAQAPLWAAYPAT
jgi:hypothetical protein